MQARTEEPQGTCLLLGVWRCSLRKMRILHPKGPLRSGQTIEVGVRAIKAQQYINLGDKTSKGVHDAVYESCAHVVEFA